MELTCNEALGVIAIRYHLTLNDFKLLAEWLDCYNYVLPANRVLDTELIFHIASRTIRSPSDIFKLWLASDLLFSCFTLAEQKNILSWMLSTQE